MPSQYHHYVPRFILRQFQPPENDDPSSTKAGASTKSRRERERERAKARRLGLPVDTENIAVFDMATRSIKTVPLAKAFGFINLYEDDSRIGDTGHLESKLASLEREASVVLNTLHLDVKEGATTFTISRTELELLRKFLFLMHYRKAEHIKTYFQEDHPSNADIRDWIRHVKKRRGYTSDHQIWLDGLRYYLDTPHFEIITTSRESMRQIGGNLDVKTPVDQWHSIAYGKYSNNYFMGIWLASEGSEFVLGDNSYGLWEGTFMGYTGLFHIYVVSPQITLVLKMTLAKGQGLLAAFENSTLSNHPLDPPRPLYVNTQLPTIRLTDHPSVLSKDDKFTYTIHQLSDHQTYHVNQVVLSNLRHDSLLVFASKAAMAKTALLFDKPPGPGTLSKVNRGAIQALSACLLGGPSDTSDDEDGASPSDKTVTHSLLLQSSNGSEDGPFNALLVQLISSDKIFRSDYDRAQYIYRRIPHPDNSTHPFVLHVHKSIIGPLGFASVVADKHGTLRGRFPSGVDTRTVNSLSSADSGRLLDCATRFLEAIGAPSLKDDLEGGDSLQRLAAEVSIVMFLESLLEVDANLVAGLCPSVDFVQALPEQGRQAPTSTVYNHGQPHNPNYRGGVRPPGAEFKRTISFIILSLFATLTISAYFV